MDQKPLKIPLLANAAFSTLSGLIFLLFSQPVAEFVGLGSGWLYQILGAGLLGFAAYVAWTATRVPISTFAVLQISVADGLWVVGTALLIGLTFRQLTIPGIVSLLIVADIVLLFAYFQLRGITAVFRHSERPGVEHLCVTIDTPTAADAIWPLIADMGRIGDFSPNLTTVIMRDGAPVGPNAVRQCSDRSGNTWAEHCTRLDNTARRLEVTFLADEPGFPYPFKTVDGGWEVVPRNSGSTVNIWFDVTAKNRWLQPIILTMMGKQLTRDFGEVVARMAAEARGEPVARDASPSSDGISASLAMC